MVFRPTASPHVYVAKTALDDIDPTVLFSEPAAGFLPALFDKNEFEYCSPHHLSHQLPKSPNIAEVVFLGRSNVGKSSLVNAIMKKKLCVTSKSPGRTQQPYYYGLFSRQKRHGDNRTLPSEAKGFLVDLPGYGYAAAPLDSTESWQETTQNVLLDRRDSGNLRRLFLLVDARRDGLTTWDITILKWLEEASIPYSVVLTKADRTSVPLVVKFVNQLCLRYASQQALEDHVSQSPIIHVTSSHANWGINELIWSIEAEFATEADVQC